MGNPHPASGHSGQSESRLCHVHSRGRRRWCPSPVSTDTPEDGHGSVLVTPLLPRVVIEVHVDLSDSVYREPTEGASVLTTHCCKCACVLIEGREY